MATLTVRDLDDQLKAQLRVRAAHNGRSMEAEVRQILRDALEARPEPAEPGLGTQIHRRFRDLDWDHIELPARTERARAAQL